MGAEEGGVAAVEDVNFGVGEVRVSFVVNGAVALADKFCPVRMN